MTAKDNKKTSTPPDGYVCNLCKTPGHWIQQCSERKKNNKKRKTNPNHVPVAGVDPSQTDIEHAKQMQALPAPKCFCLEKSRIKKVKKEGNNTKANSRAIGKYFFFCSKKRDDPSRCRFARPAEDVQKEYKRKTNKSKKQKSNDDANEGGVGGGLDNNKKEKEKTDKEENNVNDEDTNNVEAPGPKRAKKENQAVAKKDEEEGSSSSNSDSGSESSSSSSSSESSSSSSSDNEE